MRDLLRDIQPKDLGEVPFEDLEGEMGEDSIPKVLWKENERYRQEEEWSTPARDGREGRDVPISSPAAHGSHQRTPPTPVPSEDRLFTDWSSVRSGSSLVRTPPQSILVGQRGHETNQIAPQSSHPISEQTHMGVAEDALQENLPTAAPTAQQQSLDRSSVRGERENE